MRKTSLLLIFAVTFSLLAEFSFAQKQNYLEKRKDNQKETVDTRVDNMGYWRRMADKGLVEVAQPIPVAPAKYTGSIIEARSVVSGKEDSPDVPVTDLTNVTESENSIFANPADPENILNSNNSTGSNGSPLYGANYFLSEDGGLNWGGSPQGPGGGNSGDPATAINLAGSRMYVGYITNSYGQGVAYSTNGGTSWSQVTVSPNPGSLADKNHMWIDNGPSSPYEGQLYDSWLDFGGPYDEEIVISRSADEGLSWTPRQNISSAVNAGSHNQGVHIQTGPNGEVYAAWAIYDSWPSDETAIGFAKSTDGGVNYEPATRVISNIRGIRTSETSKNHRVNSFPVMAVDISSGQYSGNIYLVWANIGVPGVNNDGDIDVYMIRSENEGDTWSTPVKVNQDPSGLGKEHYFPWIACDPSSGILSVVFYDDRNVSSSQCEVFCANSFDAGNTWEDFKVSDVSFTPSPIPGLAGGYMGDYLGITAMDSYVYPCWTDNRGGLYMTYVSPYVTNNLPRPEDLVVTLDDATGETTLEWQYEGDDFLHFIVYRDGNELGTTTDLTYSDNLPDYGVFNYSVTAMHDDGESVGAGASIQWGDAHINVTPLEFNVALEIGTSTVETLTIENIGELELAYNIQTEITSDKGSKDYCDASGGCDEYISNVILGDINNSSGCDGYADYTDLSTNLNMDETYDITIENGNVYSSDDLGIWIDWNQDQDFDDVDENIVCEGGNGGEGTFSFTVPANAVPGETRMRIRIKWSGDDCGDPCGSTPYGEVEDYSVYVLGWLLLDQTDGSLEAGNSDDINVTLDASDLETGTYTADLNISSNDPDVPLVTVPVTLMVGENIPEIVVSADPSDICFGESTQLFADATGGSGSYTFSWTSDPVGFTSDEQNPVVSPLETTTYYVEVYDGIFTISDNTSVNLLPLPEVTISLTDSVCVYDPAFDLTGGSPDGGEYTGTGVDNGSFNPEVAGVGNHTITYTYTDGSGCENFAETSIYVSECLGINEIGEGIQIEIYPNPNKGKFTVSVNSIDSKTADLKIINNLGVTVYSENNINLDNSFEKEIDLNEYSEGLYYINLSTRERNYIRKILISK